MKKALIAPQKKCDGFAIAEVCEIEFGVSEPFFWIDCEDDVSEITHYYALDKTIKMYEKQPCFIKAKAKQNLIDTDWTVMVENDGSDMYLQNKNAFVSYRNILRNIAIDPKPVDEWPERPSAVWAKN